MLILELQIKQDMANWSFLTNHALVLLCIAQDPGIRLRELGETFGITERAAHRIVSDLAAAGFVARERRGRRNHYTIEADRSIPIRSPAREGSASSWRPSPGRALACRRPVDSAQQAGVARPNREGEVWQSRLRRSALDRVDAPQLAREARRFRRDDHVAVVVEVGVVDPRVDAQERLDDCPGTCSGGRRCPGGSRRRRRSPSPSASEVTEPPTISVATDSPPSVICTSPAANVWMSPVRKTTSLMPLRLDVLEDLAALARIAVPEVVGEYGSAALFTGMIATSLPISFQVAVDFSSAALKNAF